MANSKGRDETGAPALDFALAPGALLPYRQSVEACFAERIGPHGLARAEYEAALADTVPALARLKAAHGAGTLPLLALAAARADLAAITREAGRLSSRFAAIVLLGTGGSSLGGQALAALADQSFAPQPPSPRLYFLDNIDPERWDALFASLELGRTGFLAVSKSGATPETMAQFLTAFAAVAKALGARAAAQHFTVITEPGDNPMRRHAERCAIPVLDHDPAIGGRFSALSLVGLLPARLAGIDILAVREGAAAALGAVLAAREPAAAPPAVGAALAVGLHQHRAIATTVIMPYGTSFAAFGAWFCQLWAESLGKSGKGTTPLSALGTVDQHSQLQLYLDGPADKMFTLVVAARAGSGRAIPVDAAAEPRLAYLAGRSMGDLMAAEQRATYDSLAAAGRPVRLLALERMDARALGALMMHFMLEVIIAADLLGVDPFSQPAVEDGKRRARAYLGERAT